MHEHGRSRVSQTRVVPLRLAKRFASPGVVLLISVVHKYGLSCHCDLTCLTIALVGGHNVRVPDLVLVTFCLLPPSPPFFFRVSWEEQTALDCHPMKLGLLFKDRS